MSRLYVRGASRVAGNEYLPPRSVTTATLTVLAIPFARTRTPSIGPSVSEVTRPVRANGAASFGSATNDPATAIPNASTNATIFDMIRFLDSRNPSHQISQSPQNSRCIGRNKSLRSLSTRKSVTQDFHFHPHQE